MSQFSGPVAGYFSDRCQASMGRRRPYLIIAGFFSVPALCAMKWAHNIFTENCTFPSNGGSECVRTHGDASGSDAGSKFGAEAAPSSAGGLQASMAQMVMFVGFFLIAMMAFNIQMQMLPSLISDLIPEEQTGQATGVIGVLQLLGSLLGFLLYQFISGGFGDYELPFKLGDVDSIPVTDPIGKMYYYYAPVILLCTLITLCSADEKPNPVAKQDLPPVTCAAIMKCFTLDPVEHRDFFIVTLSRTAYYCGLSTMTFLQYYFRDLVRESGVNCTAPGGSSCSTQFGGHLNASLVDATCKVGHCSDHSTCTCPVANYMAKTALVRATHESLVSLSSQLHRSFANVLVPNHRLQFSLRLGPALLRTPLAFSATSLAGSRWSTSLAWAWELFTPSCLLSLISRL
eukprot:COSAG05_NODE_263_length_12683_cov_5.884218_4_plen_401_part_00